MRQRGQHDLGYVVPSQVEKVAENAGAGGCHTEVLMTTAATSAKTIAQHTMYHDAMPEDGMTASAPYVHAESTCNATS